MTDTGTFAWGGCPSPDPATDAAVDTPTDGNPTEDLVSFSALEVGDCIGDPYEGTTEGDGRTTWIYGVTIVDCGLPHYGEAYMVATLVADTYVEDDIATEADQLCYDGYEGFMGVSYDDSTHYYAPYYPSPEGWEAGDHRPRAW